ncbi:MAG: hypothetical protein K2W82_14625 [Candidatus Obscuribacterales bacterium]|nr:hypothetical protein [Candidatus Obscuribacterales bacterium]
MSKVCSTLFSLFTAATLAANASPASFTPAGNSHNGTIKCEAPLSAVGPLPLRKGSVTVNGKVITVKDSNEFGDAPRVILAGSVLRSEANLGSVPCHLTGLVCFFLGDRLEKIDDPEAVDVIFRNEGQIQGKILGIEGDEIIIVRATQQQRIALSSVLYIRSPRVFILKIDGKEGLPNKDGSHQFNAESASLRPTAAPRSVSLSSVVPNRKPDGLDTTSLNESRAITPSSFFEDDDGLGAPQPKPTRQQSFRQRMNLPNWIEE